MSATPETFEPVGRQEAETHCLGDANLKMLQTLDCIVCDQNYGRSQPNKPLQDVEDWYSDQQYWNGTYNTRWNVAVTLYYMATDAKAYDLGDLLANSLDYRDDWSVWPQYKRDALGQALFQFWQWMLDRPPELRSNDPTDIYWSRSFAGRFFELAKKIGLLHNGYFAELFQSAPTSNRFFYDCLFVQEYWQNICDLDHPWAENLPLRSQIVEHLRTGFFNFPEHEQVSSNAEQYLAWNKSYNELL